MTSTLRGEAAHWSEQSDGFGHGVELQHVLRTPRHAVHASIGRKHGAIPCDQMPHVSVSDASCAADSTRISEDAYGRRAAAARLTLVVQVATAGKQPICARNTLCDVDLEHRLCKRGDRVNEAIPSKRSAAPFRPATKLDSSKRKRVSRELHTIKIRNRFHPQTGALARSPCATSSCPTSGF